MCVWSLSSPFSFVLFTHVTSLTSDHSVSLRLRLRALHYITCAKLSTWHACTASMIWIHLYARLILSSDSVSETRWSVVASLPACCQNAYNGWCISSIFTAAPPASNQTFVRMLAWKNQWLFISLQWRLETFDFTVCWLTRFLREDVILYRRHQVQ